MLELAKQPDRFVSASELSCRADIGWAFTRAIVRKLAACGWVESREGRSGGFRIKISPRELSVGEVIKAFQGPIRLSGCLSNKLVCQRHRSCPVRRQLQKLSKKLEDELNRFTLRDIVGAYIED
ncbi:MAG: Rrf2 family transcriptional regulator [Candidatus Omnitrophica bacterium]|nr:Rrf2 family transcriptional regulator [Candidatus Omnitrophota bacterium]